MPTLQIRTGVITTLVLDRPDKLNALLDALSSALEAIAADQSVRAVILTGAGPKAFSAGADIGDLAGSIAKGQETALREIVARGQGLTRRIEALPKLIIAAVNGLAYGAAAKSPRHAPWPSPASTRPSRNPRSDLVSHLLLADPSACRDTWA